MCLSRSPELEADYTRVWFPVKSLISTLKPPTLLPVRLHHETCLLGVCRVEWIPRLRLDRNHPNTDSADPHTGSHPAIDGRKIILLSSTRRGYPLREYHADIWEGIGPVRCVSSNGWEGASCSQITITDHVGGFPARKTRARVGS